MTQVRMGVCESRPCLGAAGWQASCWRCSQVGGRQKGYLAAVFRWRGVGGAGPCFCRTLGSAVSEPGRTPGSDTAASITSTMLVAWAIGGPFLGALPDRLGFGRLPSLVSVVLATMSWAKFFSLSCLVCCRIHFWRRSVSPPAPSSSDSPLPEKSTLPAPREQQEV
jgi:MFS family permease